MTEPAPSRFVVDAVWEWRATIIDILQGVFPEAEGLDDLKVPDEYPIAYIPVFETREQADGVAKMNGNTVREIEFPEGAMQ